MTNKDDILIFYSTCSYLAFYINTWFYDNNHFVWCSPVFNPQALDKNDPRSRIPVSSSPYCRYWRLQQDINSNDMHSIAIEQNRRGILRGALFHLRNNNVSQNIFEKIEEIVSQAKLTDFSPRIFIIPNTEAIRSKVKEVPVQQAANPLSIEYKIPNLQRNEFDIIEVANE